jgi:hypothetical protein
MSLISDSEMAAIQDLAISGMKTSVAIYHGANTQTPNGRAWGFPSTPDATVLGWLTQKTPGGTKLDVIDGQTAVSETHRLFLPVGTDCRAADKVVIAGLTYIVEHTNAGDTYPAALTCYLRIQQ